MLKETLKKDEIAAMKARDKARVSVLDQLILKLNHLKLIIGKIFQMKMLLKQLKKA